MSLYTGKSFNEGKRYLDRHINLFSIVQWELDQMQNDCALEVVELC